MSFKHIKMACLHSIPIIKGLPHLIRQHPVFAFQLLLLRLGYFLTRKILFSLSDPYGFKIQNNHILITYWAIFVEQEFINDVWVDDYKNALNPVAYDIGANGGVFTYMLTRLNPEATVHMIEPLPEMTPVLENSFSHLDNITLHSLACSNIEGTATFYTDGSGDTDSSLVKNGRETKQTITVNVTTLDQLNREDHIELIKIDTQGNELSVLKGATETLKKTKYLLLELTTEQEYQDVKNYLGAQWQSRKITYLDYIFKNSDK